MTDAQMADQLRLQALARQGYAQCARCGTALPAAQLGRVLTVAGEQLVCVDATWCERAPRSRVLDGAGGAA